MLCFTSVRSLPWCGSVPEECPCYGLGCPMVPQKSFPPAVLLLRVLLCAPTAPFPHAFSCVPQFLPIVSPSPGRNCLLLNRWGGVWAALDTVLVWVHLHGSWSHFEQHIASSHKGQLAASCCQNMPLCTQYRCIFFCSVMLKKYGNFIV